MLNFGPYLVQQETNEAKIQVESRIEMINKEIHKLEKNYQINSKKIEKKLLIYKIN